MTDFIQLPPNGSGEKVDIVQLSDGSGNFVDRQVIIIADPSTYAARAKVENADPGSSDYGLTVRNVRGSSTIPVYTQKAVLTASGYSSAVINFSATGDTPVVAGVTSQTVRVWGMLLVVSAASNIEFKNGSTALSGAMPLLAYGSLFLPKVDDPYFVTSSGSGFVINQSGTAQVTGVLWYTQS